MFGVMFRFLLRLILLVKFITVPEDLVENEPLDNCRVFTAIHDRIKTVRVIIVRVVLHRRHQVFTATVKNMPVHFNVFACAVFCYHINYTTARYRADDGIHAKRTIYITHHVDVLKESQVL